VPAPQASPLQLRGMLGTIAATEPARLGASEFVIKPFDFQSKIALDYPFTAAKATSRPRQFAATIAIRVG